MRAGAKLRVAREAKGLTLEQAASAIRVRQDFLAALEAMNLNLLPGKAYAKAYLRSYTKLLELPEYDLIAQYESESALLREDTGEQIRDPESKPRPERPWLAAAALAVVCAAFVGWRAMHDGGEEAATAVSPPPRSTSTARVAPGIEAYADDPWGLTAQLVEIEALQDAWLEVRGSDGTIFLSKTMRRGERYTPDVGAGWTLHAEDGGSFKVWLNTQDVGLLGQPQSPVLGRGVDSIAGAALSQG
jgi:cytoskeleton protein RodZ